MVTDNVHLEHCVIHPVGSEADDAGLTDEEYRSMVEIMTELLDAITEEGR